MGHDSHPLLDDSALQAFVTHVAGAAREYTGDVAFHSWTTIATGTGQLHLVRGALSASARLGEDAVHILRRGRGVERCDGLGDTDGEQTARMQCLSEGRVLDSEVSRH
jgi:hypothetical protein